MAIDYQLRAEALQSEVDRLTARVRDLEQGLGIHYRGPIEWRLTPCEARIVGILMHREIMTRDAACAALYSDKRGDAPDPKIVAVFICKMRKKLKPFGIAITTHWGSGYSIAADVRQKLKAAAA